MKNILLMTIGASLKAAKHGLKVMSEVQRLTGYEYEVSTALLGCLKGDNFDSDSVSPLALYTFTNIVDKNDDITSTGNGCFIFILEDTGKDTVKLPGTDELVREVLLLAHPMRACNPTGHSKLQLFKFVEEPTECFNRIIQMYQRVLEGNPLANSPLPPATVELLQLPPSANWNIRQIEKAIVDFVDTLTEVRLKGRDVTRRQAKRDMNNVSTCLVFERYLDHVLATTTLEQFNVHHTKSFSSERHDIVSCYTTAMEKYLLDTFNYIDYLEWLGITVKESDTDAPAAVAKSVKPPTKRVRSNE